MKLPSPPLALASVALLAGLVGVSACSRGSTPHDPDADGTCAGSADCAADAGGVDVGELGAFELRPDFDGPCQKAKGTVDVNLGNTACTTVRALHCQILGTEPSEETLTEWAGKLVDTEYTRRVDVARTFCQQAGRNCSFEYSDPWLAQEDLTETCERKTDRDVGAVLMFFSDCPNKVNCSVDWPNTHTLGFTSKHLLYGEQEGEAAYYNPRNSGFWRRELLDARWAGLQFVMLNVYGPDLAESTGVLSHLEDGLVDVPGIQVALFDDTWIWGKGSPVGNLAGIWGPSVGAPWTGVPNFDDPDAAAATLYTAKWKPFFEAVPQDRWYTRDGKPVVYFYNAGTFGGKAKESVAVLNKVKQLFLADFGVEPFIVLDTAFFIDDANAAANGRFLWNSGACPAGMGSVFHCDTPSAFTVGGVRVDHSMVRWDSKNRDARAMTDVASEYDRIVKGPQALEQYLESSADADIAVIATWNDLGEGTGINRNYDYFYKGEWLKPNAFMSLIRQSQCSN